MVSVTPLVAANAPATRMRPSGCNRSANTEPEASTLPPRKVPSTEPSPFNRASRWLGMPATAVKSPPMIVRPSGCNTRARTPPFGPVPVAKVVSSVPSKFSRATKLRFVPLTTVNRPPSTTRPLFCTATALTRLSTLATKFVSGVPSELTRARLVRPTPPTVSNSPPNTTLPALKALVYTANDRTVAALVPNRMRPASNPPSMVPSRFNRARLNRLAPLKVVKSPAT